ncbi:MAG: leucine-rich repeat domain-containing protein [Paludibacteraceae bacterium]|nr:leucine-rich repeat domain-containing protein [Paludibacteraceae bacterium]
MQKISLLLVAAACSVLMANARIHKGDLYYEEDEGSQTAYVTFQSEASTNYENIYVYVTVPDYFTVVYSHGSINYNLVGVGEKAFRYCPLKYINLPSTVTFINDNAFQFCSALEKVEFKQGSVTLTNIGDRAFYQCSALKDINLENVTIQRISPFAFYQCYGLTDLVFNNGLQTIEEKAFAHCTGLKTLSLPASMAVIGDMAFQGCTGLETIYCYAEEAPVINDNTFLNVTRENVTVYVPKGSFLDYRSNGWFGFNIVEMGEQGIDTPSLQGRSGEASKLLRNGQLLIEKNGKLYNAQGTEIR